MSDKGTILIVEDERDLRITLGQLLELFGYNIINAANGEEALKLLKTGSSPRAILLDMMMPIMNGDSFLEMVSSQAELSDIPVIQMSAANLRKHKDACCALDKPFEISNLVHLIETCPRIVARQNQTHL